MEEEFENILKACDILEEIKDDNQEIEPEDIEGEVAEEQMHEIDNSNTYEFQDESIQGFFDHYEPVYSVDIHPTQLNVACSGGGNDKAYLWRIDNGELIAVLTPHSDSVVGVAFSADGQFIATGSMDGKIHVSLALSGQHVITLEGPSEVTVYFY